MGTSTIALASDLRDTAAHQGGFFTAAQAVSLGYADSVHGYHVRNGDWERVGRGIYRLKDIPPSKWPDLFIFLLWSRGKDGATKGVFCRETALRLHGCTVTAVEMTHLSVPPAFRRNTPTPKGLKLYHEHVSDGDRDIRNGLPVTTMAKTMIDIGELNIKPKIIPEKKTSDSSADARRAARLIVKPGEWKRGVSFQKALEQGED